jgi:hypothetical protein
MYGAMGPPRMRRTMRWVVLLLALLPATLAWAAPPKPTETSPESEDSQGDKMVRGWLLRIDGDEFVIDRGTADGLHPGTPVKLYRTIRARHPLTGKEVLDRFPVGDAAADEVAAHLAILKPDEKTRRTLQVGDMVEFVVQGVKHREVPPHLVPEATTPTPPPSPSCPMCPPPPRCPEVVGSTDPVLDETFRQTLGRTPPERILLWRKYAQTHPDSPLLPQIRQEIDALNEQSGASKTAREDAQRIQNALRLVSHDRLARVRVGEPVWLVFSAADWSQVTDLRVHWRRKGEGTYELARPQPSGVLHRRFRLPDAVVREPGLEYYAVVTQPDGTSVDLVGTVRAPQAIEVTDPFAEVGRVPHDATMLRILGEYVDFNRFRRDDQVTFAEVSVLYRLQEPELLYAFELGYGLFNGGGGKVAGSDLLLADGSPRLQASGPAVGTPIRKYDTIDPRTASFKYAWVSTEWAFLPQFHGITRFVVGLGRTGLDSGLELQARIGPERGTNLRVGVSTLADLGRAASVALTTHAIERVPMSGIFEVTNRPVGEDIGIRLIYQADWRWTEHVGLIGRLGYNLRTVDHAGLSVGGGMVFAW